MWPPHRPAARLREYVIERHVHAECHELLDDLLAATLAHVAQRAELSLDDEHIPEVQAEQVRFRVSLHRAELDAVDDPDPELGARGLCFGEAAHRIMVRERDGGEASGPCRADHVRRRTRAIGRGGVHVEIDEHRRTRRSTHGA